MKKMTPKEMERTPKILLYGLPGVGKSVLAAQAPHPVQIFDFEAGATYVHRLVPKDRFDVFRNIDPDEVMQTAEALYRDSAGYKYKSIVLDSLSELQRLHRVTLTGDRLQASMREWGENTEWLRRVVRLLVSCPLTIVFICQANESDDEGSIKIRPSLSPSIREAVVGYVDMIVYMRNETHLSEGGKRETVRVAYTAPGDKWFAKDRGGILPEQTTNPTWDDLFGKLTPAAKAKPKKKTITIKKGGKK